MALYGPVFYVGAVTLVVFAMAVAMAVADRFTGSDARAMESRLNTRICAVEAVHHLTRPECASLEQRTD